jgi:hypothetical protein
MKMFRLVNLSILMISAMFMSTGSIASSNCTANLQSHEVVAKGYRLALVAHRGAGEKDFEPQVFYVFDGSCECSFSAPDGIKFTWKEVKSAAESKKGLIRLVAKITTVGNCPSSTGRASRTAPLLTCIIKGTPTCKGLTN